MRKVVLLMHTSLDGFAAGPNGEMDWIQFDESLADYAGKATEEADTAIYGRITYGMMEAYWPTAAQNPGATKHDIQHGNWYNNAMKIVFSKTMEQSTRGKTRVIRHNMKEEIEKLKKQPGKNLLLIGSISIVHAFLELDLIDEYLININPVILGEGKSLFRNVYDRKSLKLIEAKTFDCNVVGLRYEAKRG